MEIYTLNISFPYDDEDQPWSKTIEVKEDFTLLKLHKYIQKLVDFDDDHLYEFYVGKNPNNRTYSVPKKLKLNEIYPLSGQKLFYLFDFGDCWLFQIKKSRKKKNDNKELNHYALKVHRLLWD
jgi:pRiA4b ORF-3-like protein